MHASTLRRSICSALRFRAGAPSWVVNLLNFKIFNFATCTLLSLFETPRRGRNGYGISYANPKFTTGIEPAPPLFTRRSTEEVSATCATGEFR
jgi:hypothetical protein